MDGMAIRQERRNPKEKAKKTNPLPMNVQVIPKKEKPKPGDKEFKPKRVAAYCRVSTLQEQQETSIQAQQQYYNELIEQRPDWVNAGVYVDWGKTGTQTKHREQFNKIIADAEAGLIDMIITKSSSRFARNTLDFISVVRRLKKLRTPVGVYFEKDQYNSLDEHVDFMLTLMASFAQEESRTISSNVRWGILVRMQNGTFKIQTQCLLGYDTSEDGHMYILPEEAKIVEVIYENCIRGKSYAETARILNDMGVVTIKGNPFTGGAVKNILLNEKYCGDVLMQKTFVEDYLTHKSVKNTGQMDQYYIKDHHPAIIAREDWELAQDIIARKRKPKKPQKRLKPIKEGTLKGFVPMEADWTDLPEKRLISASERGEGMYKKKEKYKNEVST
ncbi:recombinase family protein [Butyrivibrio sp. INlla14]|uniref:recombinase family protein n=1 Tax=Butyrivibrio sp. INlla14 TaxID=1520808 RepID=UPI0008763FA0|nr:recombinase family protein [Butyrivibrio sp. INlla14]SCY13375.1 Site-specific DNA recombinase [Butyrivibrio sp. INlla14]